MRAIARSVSRRARQAHAGRALCAGLGSLILVVALGLNAGESSAYRALGDPELLALAVGVGVLAFVAWIGSTRLDEPAVVRRIDARLRLGGGLVAAYENGGLDTVRPVAELDAHEVLSRTPRNAAREAAIPHVVGFIALPFAALVLLVQAVDARDASQASTRRSVGDMQAVTAGLSGALEGAEAELGPEAMQRLSAAAAAAVSGDEAERGELMRELADEIEAAVGELPPDSDLAAALEELAFEAELAAPDEGPRSPAESPTEPTAEPAAEPFGEDLDGPALSAPEPGPEPDAGSDFPNAQGPGGASAGDDADRSMGEQGPAGGEAGESGETGSATVAGGSAAAAVSEDETDRSGAGSTAPQGARSARASTWWGESDAAIVEGWLAIVGTRR